MPDAPVNILLITSDQQHFSTLGCTNPHIRTPSLDRLAREGSRFTRAYTNNPVCTPTRATIITGLYPAWHGAWTIGVKLPEDVPTLGGVLRERGYDTTLVGKAHFQPLRSVPGSVSVECQPTLRDLDFWKSFPPSPQGWYGFEHVETCRNHADESHVGGHYALWMRDRGLANWSDYFVSPDPHTGHGSGPSRRGVWDLPQEFHYTTWTAQRSIAHIERAHRQGKPFFLWSSFHDPHPPYLVPQPWASMYRPQDMPIGRLDPEEVQWMCPLVREALKPTPDFSAYRDPGGQGNHGLHSHVHDEQTLRQDMAVYYGMTSFMDQQIGGILAKLDELGIAQDTLVVFTSDHGHFLGQHGLIAKAFMYEDNLRVPFLVRWPGHVPAGVTRDSLQALVDLAPTFLSAAGVEVPGQMQGVSQLDVWSGSAAAARDHVLVEHRHQPTRFTTRSYIDAQHKLTVYRGHEWGELYDLQADPGELRNRWDDPAYARVKAQLMMDFLQAEMVREPTRMPRIAGA